MSTPVTVSIEYCIPSGYGQHALSLTQELLNQYVSSIEALTLIPSGKGMFEVIVDDELVFSKKEIGRLPTDGEIESLFVEKTGATVETA